MSKNDNFYEVIKIISSLGPDDQKRIATLLQKRMDELKVNLPQIVESALEVMVMENPNPNLKQVYNRVRTQNILDLEAKKKAEKEKQELERMDALLKSANDLISQVENRKIG